ncbi:MAG: hypothetical protein OEM25_09330, partial [Gammaproteobacteria bacterium]|nr:hypothetical protein [Gammaproteobacteria bacterium]
NGVTAKSELHPFEADTASIAAGDAPERVLAEPQAPATQAIAAPNSDKRLGDEGRQEPAHARNAPAEVVNIAEFEVKDTDLLRRADEMARMQDGESQVAESPITESKELLVGRSASFAASDEAIARSAAGLSSDAPACDEDATSTAESWIACIGELEDAGFTDEASQQWETLLRTFPDAGPR